MGGDARLASPGEDAHSHDVVTSLDWSAISGGVSETMLLTLWGRAEAARTRPEFLQDPRAREAIARIDFDFSGRFGKPSLGPTIRAKWSDALLEEFLDRHPDSVVVALGEGLETQFWRVDNGRMLWVSVDLPDAISIRRKALPQHERNILAEASATDQGWLGLVPRDRPIVITACGLLMYLEPDDVMELLQTLAREFPGAELLFDTIPGWVSRRAAKGLKLSRSYVLPPMPFGLGLGELESLSAAIPSLSILSASTYGEAFPAITPFTALASRWPYFRNRLSPALVRARFAPARDDRFDRENAS